MILGYDDSLTESSIVRLIVGSILRLIEELHVGLDVIMAGFDDGPTEESSEGDALGSDDRWIDGAALGFADGSELGMDDRKQDGTAVGDTLGARVGDTLGKDDAFMHGTRDGAVLGFTYSPKLGIAVGSKLGLQEADSIDSNVVGKMLGSE